MKEQQYSIGEAAKIFHISIQTLRYYDEIGLITPSRKNSETNYRYYNIEQLLRIQTVKQLKDLQFSLQQIQDILKQDIPYLQSCIQNKMQELDTAIRHMKDIYQNAQLFAERLSQGDGLLRDLQQRMSLENSGYPEPALDNTAIKHNIQIEQIPAQDIIFLRNIQTDYSNANINIDRWSELLELVHQEQVVTTGPLSVIYHQKPLEQFYINTCDYEVAFPIASIPDSHAPHYRHEESFQAVTLYCVGSYEQLLVPYMDAMRWINENHYTISGEMRDSFIISPLDTTQSKEYLTKIIIPVKQL